MCWGILVFRPEIRGHIRAQHGAVAAYTGHKGMRPRAEGSNTLLIGARVGDEVTQVEQFDDRERAQAASARHRHLGAAGGVRFRGGPQKTGHHKGGLGLPGKKVVEIQEKALLLYGID